VNDNKQRGFVLQIEGRFRLADRIEAQLAQARLQVDKLTPSILACAWTHSLHARSGCALSLREILFARSHRVQIRGHLVLDDATDEPVKKLLERINTTNT